MHLITLFVVTVSVLAVNGLAVCPEPNIDISPCICIDDVNGVNPSAIQCSGDQVLDLAKVFGILDANIGPTNRSFKTFYLNNTLIEEIPYMIFKDLTFEEIYIEGTDKLSKINPNTFNGLEDTVKRLHLRDTKLNLNSENYSDIRIFDGLKKLELMDFSTSKCPSSDLLGTKCKCDSIPDLENKGIIKSKSVVIECIHVDNSEELSTVFDGLNANLKGNERNFFKFHLKESKISQLNENLFKGITFTEIFIEDCPQLEQINRNIFVGVEPFVNCFSIHNIDLKNDSKVNEDLWYAISGLKNLVDIDFINVFDEIPDKAFKNVTGPLPRFKTFSHSGYESPLTHGHRITKVGRYAFNNLPNIQIINLRKNSIESIDKYAFANQMSSEKRLLIHLAKNNLNPKSFSVGSLAGTQRPVSLEVGQIFVGCNRDLVHLEESVFSAFLDKAGNELDMGCAFLMECECNMKWLYDAPESWRSKVRTGTFGDVVLPCELDSEDGIEEVSIWDLPENYFECIPGMVYKNNMLEPALNTSAENAENVENEVNEEVNEEEETPVNT